MTPPTSPTLPGLAGDSNTPPTPLLPEAPAMANNQPPQADNTSVLVTSAGVQYMVEGDEIDLDIMQEPGWRTIRARISSAASKGSPPSSKSTEPERKPKRQQNTKKKPTIPREDPLPPDEYKIVMRPQSALDLSKVNAALLADAIFIQSQLTNNPEDQIRVNIPSNFIVDSTPFKSRAQQYLQLAFLQWHSTTYPLQNHIPPPSTTTSGAIFQIPPEDPEPLITKSLTRHNPTIIVLDARRMKGTDAV
ncbi:hypothetical protein HPB48_010819 [Haemaphysalis longicornis]|uniref:Uncharacterized protein n=1 Tax=Haemaphysalis longicornis TaxID=44386 RepID=A0A9J6GTK4_HAELO|nr:hypothetical protein HPB48_010819 [Haemaphysalis longicornis]